MASKRGQLIQRGEKTWLVRVYLGRENGKRRFHNKTIRGTKKQAERYLTKKLNELDTGTFVEPSRESVEAYLTRWLNAAVRGRVRARTLSDYRGIVRRYLIPALGKRPLATLRPEEIQSLYTNMQERGLSPRTVRFTHAVLRNALRQAVRWRILGLNPADAVSLPKRKRREMRAMSPEEARRFLEAAEGDRWAALWELLLTSGLRPGEALGLRWTDLDADRIRVQRALVWAGGPVRFEELKTDKSRRTIPLPPSTLAVLQRHRVRQAEERLKAGPAYEDQGLIFATRKGGPIEYGNLVRRHFKPLLKAAKIPAIRVYDLRHSCATLMLAAGVNPKIVSERLGHATVTLTLDTYSHVLPTMQEDATAKLGKLLSGA